MTKGWRNESGRHALAARGIPTVTESRVMLSESKPIEHDLPGSFGGLHKQISGLERGVINGDPESMESFVLIADEIIANAGNLGLGKDKYIRCLRKARSNVGRALIDPRFQYKYLRKKYRPFQYSRDVVYMSKADDDMWWVFTSNAYKDFRVNLKNMELRRRIL